MIINNEYNRTAALRSQPRCSDFIFGDIIEEEFEIIHDTNDLIAKIKKDSENPEVEEIKYPTIHATKKIDTIALANQVLVSTLCENQHIQLKTLLI